jgi:hypothetical protein
MPSYVTARLEFSEDRVSDATPTWANVTSDLRAIDWSPGVGRDGDDPTAGGATIAIRNTNRRWVPDYENGEPPTLVVL